MLYALDLETVCNVKDCKGFGDYKKCEHALSPWHDRITVLALVGNGSSWVFRDIEEFKAWMFNQQEPVTFTGHNFKFDLLHLWVHCGETFTDTFLGTDQWVGDSMLAAYVCTDKIPESWMADYNEAKKAHKGQRDAGIHSLKTTAPYFLGVAPFWEVVDMDDDDYVTKDARYSLQLTEHMEARLRDLGQYEFYKESLLPWVKMLLKAEYRGVCIDMQALEDKEIELLQKKQHLLEQLNEVWKPAHLAYAEGEHQDCYYRYEQMALEAQKPFEPGSRYYTLYTNAVEKLDKRINYDSPLQMTWLLKTYLGYDITTIEGKESTGIEVLERLKSEGHEDVGLFIELRSVEKLLNGFIESYKDMQVNGVIHPSFNPARTSTGRLSSSRPNLQQVPPELRPLFIPRKGYKFISYDYSGIEGVLIALYSSDPALYTVLNNKLSIHDYNTKVFFDLDCDVKDVKKLYPAERQASKTVGFALFYGAGRNRIQTAFTQAGYPITEQQAANIHSKFKQAYRVAYSYGQQVVKHLEQGEVINGLLGRPVRIQNPEDAFMTGFNSLIQGSASDITLNSAYEASRVQYIFPLLFVHDSTTFETPEDLLTSADDYIKMCFTDYKLTCDNGPIKLEIEGGTCDRWEK